MFDLLFLVVVGLSTAFAVLRGGLRELATLLALAVAGALTLLVIEPVLAATGQTGSFFGSAIIACVLVGVLFVIAHIGLHLGLNRIPVTGRAALANRIGGGVFGFVRGVALIGLGYLGYSYYLDEASQPESVRGAITQPLAAGVAGWFEGFAPEAADLDAPATADSDAPADAAVNGYDRTDRNSLNEIVTTVTTTDPTITDTAPGANPAVDSAIDPLRDPSLDGRVESSDLDAIADILKEDNN